MAIRLSCSSCNSSFVLPVLTAEGRGPVPRCIDVFPVRGYSEESDPGGIGSMARLVQACCYTDSGRSIRRDLIAALAIGRFNGAGCGSGHGTHRPNRRLWRLLPEGAHPDQTGTRAGSSTISSSDAGHSIVGLGYLPADATIVFSLQPGPVLAYARRTTRTRDFLIAAGLPRAAYDTVAAAGTLTAQIDHIAGGASVAELRFAMTLVLRRPLDDEEEFLKRLKARKANGPNNRYRVDISGLPVELMLARISPTIWVFGLDAKKDFEAVDKGSYRPWCQAIHFDTYRGRCRSRSAEAAAWLATAEGRGMTSLGPVLPRPVRREDRVVEGTGEGAGGGRGALAR